MRLVLFSRVPRWYSFRQDRLVKRLVADGHEVAGVIAEQTKTLKSLDEWLFKLGPKVFWQKASKKIFGQSAARETSAAGGPAIQVNPRVYRVASHNSKETVEAVSALQPDVIILRGCGIIKKQVLQIPRVATINPHYALLPAYRGMDVTEWSALHGDPVAVSVHTVNEGVDTGTVIVSKLVNVEAGDTVGVLRDKSAALAVELIAEALRRLDASGLPLPAGGNPGHQYFTMHPRLRELANQRLRAEGVSPTGRNIK